MKLPESIEHLLHRRETDNEVFLSLLLAPYGVGAAAWYLDAARKQHTVGVATQGTQDHWEHRVKACDRALAAIEEKLAETTKLQKVVLGLPPEYLTQKGEIEGEIRPQIKHLTRALDLSPLGFIAIHQAVVYKLKQDEGVPPSVILLWVTKKTVVVALYRVGALVGERNVEKDESFLEKLEGALKSFPEVEVLPSRMLLYSVEENLSEETKALLLRHPWPTKANFLHFPKIETVSFADTLTAISLAGASELATSLGEDLPAQEEVELVSAEAVGFQKTDVLQAPPPPAAKLPKFPKLPKLPTFRLPKLPNVSGKPKVSAAIAGACLILFLLLFLFILPKAEITILALATPVETRATLSVDPTATVVDSQTKVIPGKTQEKTVSGEKTIATTGKKEIGDPARGTVTIYNKSLSAKTFKKGAIVSAGTLDFTLESDVSVASASESIGSITFGKAPASIVAVDIGTSGNLSANTEFTFKDVSSSVAVARGDQALSGGTSRQVQVVSRADADTLVQALTEELVERAKQELSGSVAGGERLVDETIETKITEKSFTQEIDQEAPQLQGKITTSVSGISYSEKDLTEILTESVASVVPPGYGILASQTQIQAENATLKKDGTITLSATLSGLALPTYESESVRKGIRGKSITGAQEYLKSLPGVGGVEFRFRWSFLLRNRLPPRSKNISITIEAKE